jgi:hypothetical protein
MANDISHTSEQRLDTKAHKFLGIIDCSVFEGELKSCSESAQNHHIQRELTALKARTFQSVRLRGLAPPPVMPDEPIFFLAKRPAVKRSLALAASLKLKWPFFSPSAFGIIAYLQQHISFSSFHNLLAIQ